MLAMSKKGGRAFDVPWNDADLRWLVDELWPRLGAFVNGPRPDNFKLVTSWLECRDRLGWIIRGRSPLGRRFPRLVHVPLRLAINRDGELGCARMGSDRPATMTVRNAGGVTTYEGSNLFV